MPESSLAMADCKSLLLHLPTSRLSTFAPRFLPHRGTHAFPTSLAWRHVTHRFCSNAFLIRVASSNGGRPRHKRTQVYMADTVETLSDMKKLGSECWEHALSENVELDTAENSKVLSGDFREMNQALKWSQDVLWAACVGLPALMSFADAAYADSNGTINVVYSEVGAGLQSGVQLLYLAALLGLVAVGSFLVVRQILIRRELESAAKDLQERVRTGEALAVEYFELGAVMLRKRFFILASKYLEQAIEKWDGDAQDLAQVHNALGFSYVSEGKIEKGIAQYERAVKLQPGYVVAWNNLGNVYEKKKDLPKALKAYEQALLFDPNNQVAREYRDSIKQRLDRLEGVPMKFD